MKVVALKRSASDRKAEEEGGGFVSPDDDGGISIHLSHHHLKKMGLDGDLKSGHKVKLRGHGHVESSESRSEKGGERYSARLRLTHAGADGHGEPDADDKKTEREGRRSDIEKAYTESEKKRK
jgi:hypothetical protein